MSLAVSAVRAGPRGHGQQDQRDCRRVRIAAVNDPAQGIGSVQCGGIAATCGQVRRIEPARKRIGHREPDGITFRLRLFSRPRGGGQCLKPSPDPLAGAGIERPALGGDIDLPQRHPGGVPTLYRRPGNPCPNRRGNRGRTMGQTESRAQFGDGPFQRRDAADPLDDLRDLLYEAGADVTAADDAARALDRATRKQIATLAADKGYPDKVTSTTREAATAWILAAGVYGHHDEWEGATASGLEAVADWAVEQYEQKIGDVDGDGDIDLDDLTAASVKFGGMAAGSAFWSQVPQARPSVP